MNLLNKQAELSLLPNEDSQMRRIWGFLSLEICPSICI